MPLVRHGNYTYKVSEAGVFVVGQASKTNLIDPEFTAGLHKARQRYDSLYGDRDKQGYVYVGIGNPFTTRSEGVQCHKIGSTFNSRGRMSAGIDEIIHVIKCDDRSDAFQLEAHFHRVFDEARYKRQKEWFLLASKEVAYVLSFTHVSHELLLQMRENEHRYDVFDLDYRQGVTP